MLTYELEVAYAFTCVKLITAKANNERDALIALKEEAEKLIDTKQIKIQDCTRPLMTVLTSAVRSDTGEYLDPTNLFSYQSTKKLIEK
jgi:RNase adaptor protein for sRNA GlmZ degradation